MNMKLNFYSVFQVKWNAVFALVMEGTNLQFLCKNFHLETTLKSFDGIFTLRYNIVPSPWLIQSVLIDSLEPLFFPKL